MNANAYVSMSAASHNLNELLADLALGETLTLADENGAPIALLVSLQSATKNAQGDAESKNSDPMKDTVIAAAKHDLGKQNESFVARANEEIEVADEWVEQMKALAARVSASWQGEKSGLEELAEMRR